MGIFHNSVVSSISPDKNNFPSKYSLDSYLSKTTVHPASQIFLVDIKDECANPGAMFGPVMVSGSHDMNKLHEWVDLMLIPLRNVIMMGLFIIVLFFTGAPSIKKCPIAPESDTACLTALVTRFVL